MRNNAEMKPPVAAASRTTMHDDLKKILGSRLRNRRQHLRLTQDDVATRAGFSSKYISEIERGCRDMPLSTLCRIVESGLTWRIDEALFGLTSLDDINDHEEQVSPLVQKLALDVAALPEATQYQVVEVLRGIVGLVTDEPGNIVQETNGTSLVPEPQNGARL